MHSDAMLCACPIGAHGGLAVAQVTRLAGGSLSLANSRGRAVLLEALGRA